MIYDGNLPENVVGKHKVLKNYGLVTSNNLNTSDFKHILMFYIAKAFIYNLIISSFDSRERLQVFFYC